MRLEFDLYKVEDIGKNLEGFIQKGEFIVVGELMVDNEEYFMCHTITDGIKLIDGVNIQDFSYRLPKNYFKKTGESVELDIPKNYLTLDIIEDIQRLN
ncbi:hypothetical protein [Terrisporobacter muris]|uniref:Uncharacterized protein n=1 Tax=Terrisporobacter muris TaxID=2963284 RepID=A0A9X2MBX6_9FIRM|nr:hypothetical protein [Terrisporobacter muris]MCR1821271.1 hypothetical protein [Terrisporobacter muris]